MHNQWHCPIVVCFILLTGLVSCDTTNSLEQIPPEYADLPGTLIARDTVWAGELQLKGQYYVMPGVTLTIQPGTTVKWEYHNDNIEDVGALITLPADRSLFEDGSRPSGKLVAEGTASAPIVFTSARTQKRSGDWGGIILAGDAPVSADGGTGRVEGLPQTIRYGGENPLDDSGSLRYVRMEYLGYGFAPGSEINGLSLYGIGSNTTLEYLQVYKSTDDGFEWFGGTVNANYLVSMYADDDSFDIDQGWSGYGQFWLAVQEDGADNGVEADGTAGNFDGPEIFNMTLIGHGDREGDDSNNGMHLRNGFKGLISNTLIYRFGGQPWQLDDAALTNYQDDVLKLNDILIFGNGSWKSGDLDIFTDSFQEADPLFPNPIAPDFNFKPQIEASLFGNTPPDNGFFDTNAVFIGAFMPFSSSDWLDNANWVRLTDD